MIEPEELPEHAGRQKIRIGKDVSERLDVVAARFRVIVTRRPRYAFRNEDGVIQAAAPAHTIEGGIPTEALLAQIAVSKYADGLPLYRQEAIYARDKVELDRKLMAQWMGKLGFELDPRRLHHERGKEGRMDLCRRNDLTDTCAWVRVGKDSVAKGICQRRLDLRRQRPADGGLSLRGQSSDRVRCTAPQGLSQDFLEDFAFHRLLAQQALHLLHLAQKRLIFGTRNDLILRGRRRQRYANNWFG